MLQTEKKYLSGGIDSDSAEHIIGEGDLLNAYNLRFGTTEAGAVGFLESVPGTTLLFTPTATGTNTVIEAVTDEAKRRLVFFEYNSLGSHSIYCYDLQANTTYILALNADITGGLNFSLMNRIQAKVIGDLLYWTDYLNEPRRLNMEAAIKHYHSAYTTTVLPYSVPIAQSVITLIRRQPAFPVTIQKFTQTVPALVTNFIKDGAFEFAYRYVYRDYEESTFSMLSKLAAYNIDGATDNAITVTIPLSEPIAQDVLKVEVAVRFVNTDTGAMFIIKTWDKKNTTDATAMAAHNTGTALTYTFYNSEVGITVDPATAVKPFDVVPLKSRTQEIAKSRFFLGNNLFGYNAPVKTSLTVTPQTSDPTTLTGYWYRIEFDQGGTQVHWFIYLYGLGSQTGFYLSSLPPPITTVAFIDITYIGPTMMEILAYYGITTANLHSFNPTGDTSTITGGPPPSSLFGSQYLKSDSAKQYGIWFYDFAGRRCGVVTNKDLRMTTPDRSYTDFAYLSGANWTLSNTIDPLNEIPVEAVTYAIGRTTDLRTNFFMQLRADDIKYLDHDNNNNYTYETAYLATRIGLAINIKSLTTVGMGYVYAEGDILKLYVSGSSTIYSLKIKFTVGDWVITDLVNLGTLPVEVLYEIYTPYKGSAQEIYYEVGEKFPVINPGTTSRIYGVTAGSIAGDIYLLKRTKGGVDYYTENMSPLDKFYKNWWSDLGRPNIIDTIGQQVRVNSIAWSNTFIPGTQTNGLSTFDALNVTDLPQENGDLYKLQLTSKTQDEGSVMLGICKNETSSLYLGETQVMGSDGNAFLTTSQGVIGTINALKGSFGTVHPESVKEHQGNVYWFDAYSGTVVQYSSNGLFPLANYKMTRFLRKYSKRYIEQGLTSAIPGGIDPYNNEYMLSLPQVEFGGGLAPQLPGGVSRVNEYDIYDGRAKTLSFKIGSERFVSAYSFVPECLGYIGTQVFGLFGGVLYRHNDTAVADNFFYGTQYTTRLMFIANSLPGKIKVYNSIAIEANMAPSYTCFYGLNPNEQITDLFASDYRAKEGVYYASILRDRLSPNAAGTTDQKLYTGDKIRTSALKVMLEFTTTSKKLQLRFVNVSYHVAAGHLT